MERQYICTERAHFMCPNMHFGILVDTTMNYEKEKLENVIYSLAQAHPFLRSTIDSEDDGKKLYYKVGEESTVTVIEKQTKDTLWEDYKELGVEEWNVFKNGLLRVLLYPSTGGMQILFVAHHLLGDGRCLLELVQEFADLYGEGKEPEHVAECLIQRIEDLPDNSKATGISKYLIKRVNAKWRKERQQVDYETYAAFSNQFVKENPTSHKIQTVSSQVVRSMKQYCTKHAITLNDLLMAKLYREMPTQKIIIAADIRDRLSCYQKGACGNYATAMGIMCKDKSDDIVKKAKYVHEQVKKYIEDNSKLMLVLSCYLDMDKSLIDAVPIATMGEYKSKAARFVGNAMFGYGKRDGVSITNLGKISNPYLKKATFIPPASPATVQTIGVLTVNDNMQLCSSYYQKSISDIEVERQLMVLGSIE